ncbi:hypothetical protein D9758_007698 [Tetrapyrgos nigripes]|uniref:Uncharacterized protein n=1 Tax=Tetrapyrgos nigripes TaxID=182062 RepID=A0A8H5G5A9_9AGAR|nr:hypothetical protein D9758_007698 [Tetrapyrgos nigripes]
MVEIMIDALTELMGIALPSFHVFNDGLPTVYNYPWPRAAMVFSSTLSFFFFTRRASFIALSLILALQLPSALCAQNVTVDDTDLAIRYLDGWEASPSGNSFNFGGSHHLADEAHANATAELRFTGNAIFLMSPRWPYQVGVQVSVDDSKPISVDMKDPNQTRESGGPETVNSTVVWGTELPNGTHVLKISFLPGMQFAALDAIIFTVPDDTDTEKTVNSSNGANSSPSSNTTTGMVSDSANDSAPPTTTTTSESLPDKTIVAIAIGVLLGTALIAFLIFLIAVLLRRRRRAKKAPSDIFRAGSPYSHPPNTSLTRIASKMSDTVSIKKGYGLSEFEPAVVHISTTTERDGINAAERGERKSSAYPNPWRTSDPVDQSYGENPFASRAPTPVGNTTLPQTLTEVMDARSYFSHVRANSISDDDVKTTTKAAQASTSTARNPLPLPPAGVRALPVPK